jgi:hypothetical protein
MYRSFLIGLAEFNVRLVRRPDPDSLPQGFTEDYDGL